MDISIGCNIYKDAENYTAEKLKELVQLIDVELSNYKRYAVHYPPKIYERTAIPHIAEIESQKIKVLKLLEQK